MAKDMEEPDKIKRLEKENARLRQQNELLKKWQRYLPDAHQNELGLFRDSDKTSE